MANGDLDMETLLPVALAAGAGLLIIMTSRGSVAPPTTGYCVPQEMVQQLISLPGTNPSTWDRTGICRFYAAAASQKARFLSLTADLQDALMRMTPEQAVCFSCMSCIADWPICS